MQPCGCIHALCSLPKKVIRWYSYSVKLLSLQKPSRYINKEINAIYKESRVTVALAFPDVYEIGMSHLGLKILYTIINGLNYASAERVYAPWTDLEAQLRAENAWLSSLESKKPLCEFDIVGFSLQYELSYTTVLNMLDLGGIPVRSADRLNVSPRAHMPLIIAGPDVEPGRRIVAAVLSGITLEEAAKIAPDVLWLQLYRFHRDDHRIGNSALRGRVREPPAQRYYQRVDRNALDNG